VPNTHALHLEDPRCSALLDGAEGAGVTYARRVEGLEGADQPVESGVEDVVRRGRAGVVTSAGEGVDDLRLNLEERVTAERTTDLGYRSLQVANG
jgi:hypothetical protein